MEIPEINMISDFEAGMKCLQNPSLISRFFSFPGIEKVLHVYSFWKWGALIFAFFATFSSIIKRIKLIFIHFHTTYKPSSYQNEDIEFSEDDDISLASSDDELEEEDEEEKSPTTSFGCQQPVDQDFCVKGSRHCLKKHWQNIQLRQRRRRISGGERFDWSDFNSCKNVVKLWDSLSLSLKFGEDFDHFDSNNVVSRWEFDEYQKSNEFFSRVSNIPAVVLTAEGNENGGGVVLRGYDTRMGSRAPAIYSEWRSAAAEIGSIAPGGVGKVYVRDDVNGVVTVGDVRNVRMPLENVRYSDDDTWWDADAVIVEGEYVLVDKSS